MPEWIFSNNRSITTRTTCVFFTWQKECQVINPLWTVATKTSTPYWARNFRQSFNLQQVYLGSHQITMLKHGAIQVVVHRCSVKKMLLKNFKENLQNYEIFLVLPFTSKSCIVETFQKYPWKERNRKLFQNTEYRESSQLTTNQFRTAQKMKLSMEDFFSKCDQIRSFLRVWSHLMKKSLMENFIFCAVS